MPSGHSGSGTGRLVRNKQVLGLSPDRGIDFRVTWGKVLKTEVLDSPPPTPQASRTRPRGRNAQEDEAWSTVRTEHRS